MLRALNSREMEDEHSRASGIRRWMRHPVLATINWVFTGAASDSDSDCDSASSSDDENEDAVPAQQPGTPELPIAVLAERPDSAVPLPVSISFQFTLLKKVCSRTELLEVAPAHTHQKN